MVLGRLPLLFVIDSICKGSFLISASDFFGINGKYLLSQSANEPYSPLHGLLYSLLTGTWIVFGKKIDKTIVS